MREIEYRAYNKRARNMYSVLAIFFYQKVVKLSKTRNSRMSFFEQIDDVILMQYTEQVDKQDKRIYEKDIIKFKLSDGYDYVDDIGIVDFYKEGGEYAIFVNGDPWCNLANAKDIEVIGDIYQNKYLLEG